MAKLVGRYRKILVEKRGGEWMLRETEPFQLTGLRSMGFPDSIPAECPAEYTAAEALIHARQQMAELIGNGRADVQPEGYVWE